MVQRLTQTLALIPALVRAAGVGLFLVRSNYGGLSWRAGHGARAHGLEFVPRLRLRERIMGPNRVPIPSCPRMLIYIVSLGRYITPQVSCLMHTCAVVIT